MGFRIAFTQGIGFIAFVIWPPSTVFRLNVDVIVTYGTPAVAATKQATQAIPIVFAVAGDPVGSGLVASLARPGGNVTGLSLQKTDIADNL